MKRIKQGALRRGPLGGTNYRKPLWGTLARHLLLLTTRSLAPPWHQRRRLSWRKVIMVERSRILPFPDCTDYYSSLSSHRKLLWETVARLLPLLTTRSCYSNVIALATLNYLLLLLLTTCSSYSQRLALAALVTLNYLFLMLWTTRSSYSQNYYFPCCHVENYHIRKSLCERKVGFSYIMTILSRWLENAMPVNISNPSLSSAWWVSWSLINNILLLTARSLLSCVVICGKLPLRKTTLGMRFRILLLLTT